MNRFIKVNLRVLLLLFFGMTVIGIASAVSKENIFNNMVAPLLANHCLECHRGPTAEHGFDLSRKALALKGGKNGPAIVPGNPSESLLWKHVSEDEMPPEHPLNDMEKQVLKNWISSGAEWGVDPIDPFDYSSEKRAGYNWWSLQPLKTVKPPSGQGPVIDRFIRTKLKSKGLSPARLADPRTRVRRLYNNLHGLPAPAEVIERFAADPSPEAWAKLIEELLASKHYGERWARHWMDIARFGESGGYEYNKPRHHAWHYRDWLIRSFNDDMPYDQFVRMQLAGDILKLGTVEGSAAVGFLVAGVHNDVLGKNPKMKMAGRQDELEEIAGTVGQALLGMTVNCARCHDHKFDPISAKEYYQFIAALDGIQHGTRKLQKKAGNESRLRTYEIRKNALQRQLDDRLAARDPALSTTANIVTLKQPLNANQKGVTYDVSLVLAPTVWAGPGQATRVGDGVVVRLLTEDNQVLLSKFLESAAWEKGKNSRQYIAETFSYQGRGTGPIRIQLQPYPLNSQRFGGALDDLVIRTGEILVFREDFESLKQKHPPGTQAHTQGKVYHSGDSATWLHTGINTLHAEERAAGNLALQLFGGRATGPSPKPKTPEEKKLQVEIATLEGKIQELRGRSVTEVFTVRSKNPGVMHVHHRGDVSSQGDAIAPGGLKALSGLSPDFGIKPSASDADRRKQLANWITARDNPLFHRVAINRVWHHHFGQGIVDSPNDFGFNGGSPSHPKLLDWLAGEFRDQGYSLKFLHRLILTSETWQQASRVTARNAASIDQDNRLLWRQNPRRLDAETYRDSVLVVSGALNPAMYGPGFKDVRIDQVPPAYYYVAVDPVGPEFNRRTIYRWHVRGQRSALLDTFDCPDPSVTAPVRSVTTTPSQALSQWNHPFVLRMARQLAKRVEQESDPVLQAYRLVLGRSPDAEEVRSARALVRKHGLPVLARVLFNSNDFIWVD